MAAKTLTAKTLQSKYSQAAAAAAERATRIKVNDGDGLLLIVRPDGAASWMYRYRLHGKQEELTLGRFPQISLQFARELHAEKQRILAAGRSPRAEKAAEKAQAHAAAAQAAQRTDTVYRLSEDWIERKTGTDVHKADIRKAFRKDVLPAVGTKSPLEVSRDDIMAILRKIEGRGSHDMVRRTRMWLRQMWEFAMEDETRKLPSSPVPAGQLRTFAAHHGESYAAITNPAEVGPLLKAIAGYDHTVTRTALLLLAHTFQRPSMVREATWSEFDLNAGRWTLKYSQEKPRKGMKFAGNGAKREHWVPLSTQVVELLRRHQGVVGDVGYLFPGGRPGKPISDMTMGKALLLLGYKGKHTPHGFRAMGTTILKEVLGWADRSEVIEKHLLHEKKSKVQRAYDRAGYWEQRCVMAQEWSDWLAAQMRDA